MPAPQPRLEPSQFDQLARAVEAEQRAASRRTWLRAGTFAARTLVAVAAVCILAETVGRRVGGRRD